MLPHKFASSPSLDELLIEYKRLAPKDRVIIDELLNDDAKSHLEKFLIEIPEIEDRDLEASNLNILKTDSSLKTLEFAPDLSTYSRKLRRHLKKSFRLSNDQASPISIMVLNTMSELLLDKIDKTQTRLTDHNNSPLSFNTRSSSSKTEVAHEN